MTRRFSLLLACAFAAAFVSLGPATAAPAPPPATPATRAAPTTPRLVRAVAGNEKATLTWRAPVNGARPTGYRVQRRDGSTWVTVRDLPATARRLVVRGLTNGETARLRVAATSRDGRGAYATVSVVLPLTLQVTAGDDHTCALRADRTVVCFGGNSSGQLGDGTTSTRTTPVVVRTTSGSVLRRVESIDAGGYTTCAVTQAGEAWCWGENDDRNLGDGTDTNRSHAAPMRTASGATLRGVVGVTVSVEHTCVWLADTTARCAGSNTEGQLGRGSISGVDIGIPVSVLSNGSPLRGIVEMDAFDASTCARLASGSVVCVGTNDSGQLGVGDTTRRLEPTTMIDSVTSAPVADVRQMDAVDRHICLRKGDGTSRCTGRNADGQLATLSNDNAAALGPPLAASESGFFTPNDVSEVVTGKLHSCIISRTGRMMCAGGNSSGQLATIDTTESDQLRPTFLAPTLPLRDVTSGAAGREHTCVRLTNGSVRCVGHNDNGQLGIGAASIREVTPVRPIGL
jgi:alpha-tubulin suppressor-like RCC1 family protein